MKYVLLSSFFLIVLAIPATAWAFNNMEPGAVISDMDITTDIGTDIVAAADPCIVYRGINDHGNYVVVLAGESDHTHNIAVFATYEIDKAGSIVGLIESGTISCSIGQVAALRHAGPQSDWILLKGTYTYTFSCTIDGGLDITIMDNLTTGYTDIRRVFERVFIAVRGYVDFYVIKIANDGTLSLKSASPWSPAGFAQAADSLCYLSHINNLEYSWFAMPNDENLGWFIGRVEADGTLQNSWSGTAPFTYINGTINDRGQMINVNNNVYLTAWEVANGGHGGDGDLGVETLKISSVLSPHNSGTGWVCDVSGGLIQGVVSPATASAFVFYVDSSQGNDTYVRGIHNITTDGDILQSDMTDDYEIYDDGLGLSEMGNSICQLGSSPFIAMFGNDSGTPRLITFECNLPPYVVTRSVAPHITAYNTKIDAALDASGGVVSVGSSDVTEYGFCWNMTGNPTTSGSKIAFSGTYSSPFEFDTEIWDLVPTERYWVRAYACNESGTGYGKTIDSRTFPDFSNIILSVNFEPEQITDTTIFDQSGYHHDITYSLSTNSPDISITTGPVIPYDYAEYTCEGTECKSFWDPQYVAPENWHLPEGSRNFTNLPGMELPNELIAGTIPVRLFWITAVTLVMISIGLAGYRYLGRVLLVTAALSMCVIFFACTMSWMGWWVFGICLLMTPAPLLKAEARSPFG